MALKTACQTPGAQYTTIIKGDKIQVQVELPFRNSLTEEQAVLLEANMHNAMELCLAPLFNNK